MNARADARPGFMDEEPARRMVVPQQSEQQDSSVPCVDNPWDSWKRLLLVSAVQKYGNGKWNLVSAELWDHARVGDSRTSYLTPEACRSEYNDIKSRYGGAGKRQVDASNETLLIEELRKLRVAELKTEIERHDSTIRSLQNKLERLEAESRNRSRIGSNEFDGTAVISTVSNVRRANDSSTSVRDFARWGQQPCFDGSVKLSMEDTAARQVLDSSKAVRSLGSTQECGESPSAGGYISQRAKSLSSDQSQYTAAEAGVAACIPSTRGQLPGKAYGPPVVIPEDFGAAACNADGNVSRVCPVLGNSLPKRSDVDSTDVMKVYHRRKLASRGVLSGKGVVVRATDGTAVSNTPFEASDKIGGQDHARDEMIGGRAIDDKGDDSLGEFLGELVMKRRNTEALRKSLTTVDKREKSADTKSGYVAAEGVLHQAGSSRILGGGRKSVIYRLSSDRTPESPKVRRLDESCMASQAKDFSSLSPPRRRQKTASLQVEVRQNSRPSKIEGGFQSDAAASPSEASKQSSVENMSANSTDNSEEEDEVPKSCRLENPDDVSVIITANSSGISREGSEKMTHHLETPSTSENTEETSRVAMQHYVRRKTQTG